MSRFVEVCRKEWKRLGVPEALAEEMAADLAADLAEAESEGASPEQVLGNGVFDPRSFAASWAAARGVGRPATRSRWEVLRSPWTLIIGALASLFLVVVGLAAATSGSASMAVAPAHGAVNMPGTEPFGPGPFGFVGPFPAGRRELVVDHVLHPLGWVALAAGLVGLGLTIWLWRRWRPWPGRRGSSGLDDGVAMPSYL